MQSIPGAAYTIYGSWQVHFMRPWASMTHTLPIVRDIFSDDKNRFVC